MIRYLVKLTGTATENNVNFAGETSVCYYGKNQKLVGREGTHVPEENFIVTRYFLEEYGYKRLCDARRSWIFKNPNTESEKRLDMWRNDVEIIKVEV